MYQSFIWTRYASLHFLVSSTILFLEENDFLLLNEYFKINLVVIKQMIEYFVQGKNKVFLEESNHIWTRRTPKVYRQIFGRNTQYRGVDQIAFAFLDKNFVKHFPSRKFST